MNAALSGSPLDDLLAVLPISLLGCFKGDPANDPGPHEGEAFSSALPDDIFARSAVDALNTSGGLSGDLVAIGLADLLLLLEMGGRTGVLSIEGPVRAQLHFDEGHLFHAAVADLRGEEALFRVLKERQGRFRFDAQAPLGSPVSIHASSVRLLIESSAAPAPEQHKPAGLDGLPPLGSIVDKYRLDAVLGIGGFAAVYRATHLLLRTSVAIKTLKAKTLRDRPHLAERLCEEARFAATIDHPSIVRVFDVTHSPRLTYIVMEYIEGHSLHEEIRSLGCLPLAQAIAVCRQTAIGLQAALERGLIHRDIKPANLLLAKGGGLKIVDLGLARPVGDAGQGTDTVVGTPEYMAPEQALDPDSADFRADIYGLGITLFHAVTGDVPFTDPDPLGVIRKLLTCRMPLASERAPDCPEEVTRLIEWMTAREPERRPASYAQLVEALDELSASLRLDQSLPAEAFSPLSPATQRG